MAPIASTLALGAGCYWGTEKFIVKDFQEKFPNSIKEAKVGFMNPNVDAAPSPSYRQVCTGTTGHIEVLNLELANPNPELFQELIRFFFSFHDPTTLNRQGNDAGTQYASAIFCQDTKQKEIVEKVKNELQAAIDSGKVKAYESKQITTGIFDYTEFYPAHDAHQEYLVKNPLGYCNHRYRFREWQ